MAVAREPRPTASVRSRLAFAHGPDVFGPSGHAFPGGLRGSGPPFILAHGEARSGKRVSAETMFHGFGWDALMEMRGRASPCRRYVMKAEVAQHSGSAAQRVGRWGDVPAQGSAYGFREEVPGPAAAWFLPPLRAAAARRSRAGQLARSSRRERVALFTASRCVALRSRAGWRRAARAGNV